MEAGFEKGSEALLCHSHGEEKLWRLRLVHGGGDRRAFFL